MWKCRRDVDAELEGGRHRGGCYPWIMAHVALASSLTLVSLRLRSLATRCRKEEDSPCGKDAPLFAKTLLHHRRAAAMADDERAAFSHRVREREVNLPRIQYLRSDGFFYFPSISARWDFEFLTNKYTSPYLRFFDDARDSFMSLQAVYRAPIVRWVLIHPDRYRNTLSGTLVRKIFLR